YGARPLKRAIQKYVEDPLAEEILKGTFKQGSKIVAKHAEGQDELYFIEDTSEAGVSDEKEKTGRSES
ncbi:MAG: hypothetical protein ACM3UR_08805, partial [Bacteroidota bacterium]